MTTSQAPGRVGRVLHVTSNYPRWAGDTTTPFVHHLAADLVSRGWEVRVLAPHYPGARRREVIDGVEVHRFRYLLPESAQTLCYGSGALVNLRSSRTTKLQAPGLVAAEWAATARLLRSHTDAVHAHWILPQGFVAALAPGRVPFVLTVHGGDAFAMRGKLLDHFSRYALRKADAVTVGSSATLAVVGDLAGQRLRASVVPFGVDLRRRVQADFVEHVRQSFVPGGGSLLLFLGRIIREKGVFDAIEAVASLRSDLPAIRLAVVGAGRDEDEARALAARRGLRDVVHFAGWADSDEVPSWFAAADIVLAPSAVGRDGWQEGQGIAILEAMARGKPVIATRTGGIEDAIEDRVTGRLVEPSRPDQLAAVVRELVDDPVLAAAMGERAAARVTSDYDWEQTVDEFEALYRRAMSNAR